MIFVGNLLWFIFGGGVIAWLLWMLLGTLLFVTIIGIPFARAAWRIARFSAFPFGRELIDGRLLGDRRIIGTGLANFLWVVLAGLWLAIYHALAGVSMCVSLVGIPFGLAHFKLAAVSFAPLGKVAVTKEVGEAARRREAEGILDRKLTAS